jgi:histidyl-tRNA synthetase
MDHEGRSMKNQLKQADKQKARFALILGENELEKRQAALKDMNTGEQETVVLPEIFENWAEAIQAKISEK